MPSRDSRKTVKRAVLMFARISACRYSNKFKLASFKNPAALPLLHRMCCGLRGSTPLASIRATLQKLRDEGKVEFIAPGVYRLVEDNVVRNTLQVRYFNTEKTPEEVEQMNALEAVCYKASIRALKMAIDVSYRSS